MEHVVISADLIEETNDYVIYEYYVERRRTPDDTGKILFRKTGGGEMVHAVNDSDEKYLTEAVRTLFSYKVRNRKYAKKYDPVLY